MHLLYLILVCAGSLSAAPMWTMSFDSLSHLVGPLISPLKPVCACVGSSCEVLWAHSGHALAGKPSVFVCLLLDWSHHAVRHTALHLFWQKKIKHPKRMTVSYNVHCSKITNEKLLEWCITTSYSVVKCHNNSSHSCCKNRLHSGEAIWVSKGT